MYQRVMGSKSWVLMYFERNLAGLDNDTSLANMKRLVNIHRDQIEKYTNLDMEKVMSVTYLYEIDRVVQ